MTSNFTQIPNDLIRTDRLSVKSKMLLFIIMSYNPSFPSYAKLRQITGFGKSTISNALKELVDSNVIKYNKGSNVAGRSNLYTILDSSEWFQTVPLQDHISPTTGPIPVLPQDSNNTNIKILSSSSLDSVVNKEHKQLLDECLAAAPDHSFLKDKAERLSKFGKFTDAQLKILTDIKSKQSKHNLKPAHGGLLTSILNLDAEEIPAMLNQYDWTPAIEKKSNGSMLMRRVAVSLLNRCPDKTLALIGQIDALKGEAVPEDIIESIKFKAVRKQQTSNVINSISSSMTDDQLLDLFKQNPKSDIDECRAAVRRLFPFDRLGQVIGMLEGSRQAV